MSVSDRSAEIVTISAKVGNIIMKDFTAVVLAAGKGKRMKSSFPKVLHTLGGEPLVYHVLRKLKFLKKYVKQIILVLGYEGKTVEKEVKKYFTDIDFVYQKQLLGTASAVECVKDRVWYDNVLILCADAPLIQKKTLFSFMAQYLKRKMHSSLVTAVMLVDNDLGRIIRDSRGSIKAIREKIDLAKEYGNNREVNSGIYLFKKAILFENLDKIQRNKKKREYFLTDIIEILYKKGYRIGDYLLKDSNEILGINTQKDLNFAEQILRERIIDRFIEKGVKIIDSRNTFIERDVKIGKNTVIYPFTFIEKGVIIGNNCLIGPFIRLRKGTIIKDNAQIGNFVEVNRSTLGKKVVMKHFGYLGDAVVADKVNIGAGTVVANYDGKQKFKTVIGEGAFIGSDTVLVAPVNIGKQAVTGAGSVVVRNVDAGIVVAGVPAKFLKKKGEK